MQSIRIETDGLTVKEARELEEVIRRLDCVSDVQLWPIIPGTMQTRSLPQMGATALHLVVRLAEGAALGIGNHVYKKIGEGIVDKAWESLRAKWDGKSAVDFGVKLYGPDGELIKQHKGKR